MLKRIRPNPLLLFTFAPLILLLLIANLPSPEVSQAERSCAPQHLRTVNWSTDFCNSAVDYADILVGNPTKDGIPALSEPRLESIEEAAEWLVERSPVIALALGEEARAYPLAILMWHEIANDSIGGIPVAVTFCPLCNSAISFDRRVDGIELEFGVSGLLRNSDLIMYDRETESWWQQLTGAGLAGAYTGAALDILPSQLLSFGAFAERYPAGLVLSRDTGYSRQYGINPYNGYDSRAGQPFLFRGAVDPRLQSPVARVLAVALDDVAKAYPFALLRERLALNDQLGEVPVVIFYQSGVASALDERAIDTARDVGSAGMYRAEVDGQRLTFHSEAAGGFRDAETGSSWNAFGEAIAGELSGAQLQWIDAFPHFWFAWAAFYPETELYTLP